MTAAVQLEMFAKPEPQTCERCVHWNGPKPYGWTVVGDCPYHGRREPQQTCERWFSRAQMRMGLYGRSKG